MRRKMKEEKKRARHEGTTEEIDGGAIEEERYGVSEGMTGR